MQHVHISASDRRLGADLSELWRYRDLIWLFTKRSFVVSYKQTILGPLWLIINPLLTSVMHLIVFGGIARLSTDGLPQLLFYLAGNALWNFFAASVNKNATVFTTNAQLFGKVYFPRLVMPVANVLGNAIQFAIQLLPALVLLIYYIAVGAVSPHWALLPLLPLLLAQLGLLGTGVGVVISSLTTKYRDLSVLVTFGVTLWMYATPVVYPLSAASGTIRTLLLINPVTAPTELFRLALAGVGTVSAASLAWSLFCTAAVVLGGTRIFSRVERNFIDTV